MERELAQLAELRMKEESATELSVGLFDTKRNLSVQKGREAQEKEKKERERSEVGPCHSRHAHMYTYYPAGRSRA